MRSRSHWLANQRDKSTGDIDADVGVPDEVCGGELRHERAALRLELRRRRSHGSYKNPGVEHAAKPIEAGQDLRGTAVGLQHQDSLVSCARACDVQLPVKVPIRVQASEKNRLLAGVRHRPTLSDSPPFAW